MSGDGRVERASSNDLADLVCDTVAFVALSYAGRLNVTVIADPQRWPDLDDVVAAVEQELQVLTGTASHSAVATASS